jgi:hypothetical protein
VQPIGPLFPTVIAGLIPQSEQVVEAEINSLTLFGRKDGAVKTMMLGQAP